MKNCKVLERKISELEEKNFQLRALVECLKEENGRLKANLDFYLEYADEMACPPGEACED
ncbi:MAG: hypothetical protein PHH24_01765 [Candidatus Moranbacteria bacterium]|jgi:cell shape-determining protein MreC|nr:hypothetical protein [Candidatus Moranbacteria bacterium]MDD5652036.1 hypothetical protein [Candidatus Moranbacteria bacterium]MDX9855290.1 hypothetical protein [Candidatus Moranbacteria bacterium]